MNAARSWYVRPPLYASPEVPRGRRGYHGTASAPSRWPGVGLAVKATFFLKLCCLPPAPGKGFKKPFSNAKHGFCCVLWSRRAGCRAASTCRRAGYACAVVRARPSSSFGRLRCKRSIRIGRLVEVVHKWLPGPCGHGALRAQQFAGPHGAHSTLAGRQIDDGTFAVVEPGT